MWQFAQDYDSYSCFYLPTPAIRKEGGGGREAGAVAALADLGVLLGKELAQGSEFLAAGGKFAAGALEVACTLGTRLLSLCEGRPQRRQRRQLAIELGAETVLGAEGGRNKGSVQRKR